MAGRSSVQFPYIKPFQNNCQLAPLQHEWTLLLGTSHDGVGNRIAKPDYSEFLNPGTFTSLKPSDIIQK